MTQIDWNRAPERLMRINGKVFRPMPLGRVKMAAFRVRFEMLGGFRLRRAVGVVALRGLVFSFLLFCAFPLEAKPLIPCKQAADGLLKLWPEMKEIGGVKTGSALLKDPEARWEVPVFAFWRALIEKRMGSRDLVWNTVIIYSDSLIQCAYATLPQGQRPPEVKNLDFYEENRAEAIAMVAM